LTGSTCNLGWTWARLDDLSPRDVYDFLALRSAVFVVEQQCVFLDPDGLDAQSWHLLARRSGLPNGLPGEPQGLVAYLRVVDAGAKYAEPSIGRVITAPAARGTGLGHTLMQEGIVRATAAWPRAAIRIGAQARLEQFYRALGFEQHGGPYVEDGIPHIEMLRQAAQPIAEPMQLPEKIS
jgi:ElaA protein